MSLTLRDLVALFFINANRFQYLNPTKVGQSRE